MMILKYLPALGLYLLLAALLAGCGQKGPLYLPEPEPQTETGEAEPKEKE